MLMVDGVSKRPALSNAPVVQTATPIVRTAPRASAIGLDGIRHPLPPTRLVALLPTAAPNATDLVEQTVQARFGWSYAAAAMMLVPALAWGGYVATVRMRQLPTATVTAQNAAPAATSASETSSRAAQAEASRQLQQLVSVISAATTAPNGLVVKDLASGTVATSNDQQVFTSASLYKLFVAQGIYRAIDAGSLSLGDQVGGRSVADCLRLMITVSDNRCGEVLGTRLGWGKYNDALKTQGFGSTNLARPLETTAADVALLLERLYHGTLLSPNSTEHFLGLLKAQQINNRLPAGLPADTIVAHKTGDLDGFVHDAGIVYGPKTDYVVVMASGPWANPLEAPAAFSDLSAQLWGHFK